MMNSILRSTIAVALSTAVVFAVSCSHEAPMSAVNPDIPFPLPSVDRPAIGKGELSITQTGGAGDAVTLNTEAFAKAIEQLSAQGGGRLTVPAGVWLTGPIELKSHIELHLQRGATLLFSDLKSLYPIEQTWFEGRYTWRCQSPISAIDATDIAITGEGIIDGQGDAWRAVKSDKIAPAEWKRVVARGGVMSDDGQTWYPSESYREGASDADQNISRKAVTKEDFEAIRDFLRPNMIKFTSCTNVMLEGAVFQNSPCWTIHTVLCTNLLVDGITVRCPWYAQNGDGIDIESCNNVVVRNSSFDAGDDAICIKSGKDEEGRRRGVACSNVWVDNCICYHGHGGFVVGSEMSGGVENVAVTNCTFSGTDVGLRFKSTRGRGGVVENIYISNITMNDIATEALLFDLFYGGKSAVEALDEGSEEAEPATPVADQTTPCFRNIQIEHVVCRNARRAIYINGLPEMKVENVKVTDCSIESEYGAEVRESKGVTLDRVNIVTRKGAALKIYNATNLAVNDFGCTAPTDQPIEVDGTDNLSITIGSHSITESGQILFGSDNASSATTIKTDQTK